MRKERPAWAPLVRRRKYGAAAEENAPGVHPAAEFSMVVAPTAVSRPTAPDWLESSASKGTENERVWPAGIVCTR